MTAASRTTTTGRVPRGAGDGGFSLIEVLVMLTILTGLMATLTPLAGRMLHSWASGAARANRTDQVATALDQIRRDVAAAFPYVIEGTDPPKVRFSGSAAGFSLVTRQDSGPEQVSVRAAPGAVGKPSLLRGSRPMAAIDGGVGRETRVALLSHPFTARFAFRDRKGDRKEFWETSGEMPAAIEVTFLEKGRALFGGAIPLAIYTTAPVVCLVSTEPPASLCPTAPEGGETPANGDTTNNGSDTPSFKGGATSSDTSSSTSSSETKQ